VTDEVFSFLGPATRVVARTGRDQVVILIDDIRHRHHMVRLDEAAELVLARSSKNPFAQWASLRSACKAVLAQEDVHAVHLHGLVAGLVGAHAARTLGKQLPMFFSPHSSRTINALQSLGRGALSFLQPLLRPSSGPSIGSTIVNVRKERRTFVHWKSTELVESPVSDAFFSVARSETRHPLVITGGRTQGPRNAELMAQLAVLFSGEDLRVGFNWIGTVDKVSRLRLGAAGVSVFDVDSDAECAARLAPGWIYLAPGGTRGFPVFLVEAMAAGLPVVALDCDQHREVVRDCETGYLCQNERDMVNRIARLIDDVGLRGRMGAAARHHAQQRFSATTFDAKLLAAYALPQ
jgi:glycosyltransferase involved in cell wall biosynthesis